MKTYLEFHDGTSHKFWQIEVQDLQHNVTFGKVDTAGQSKAKSFDSAEMCLKDAEKLIKSKKAKGYAELGETAIIPEKTAKISSITEKNGKQAALDALDHLIRTGKLEDVIPFMVQYREGNSTALKKALSQAKRFWCDYQDLSKTPEYMDHNNKYSDWGRRGGERHQDIIHLLAFGLMSGSDPKSTWNLTRYIDEYKKNPTFTEILQNFKPEWLGDYLKELIITNPWTIEYELLRQLENDQLIAFDPQLFGLAIPRFRHYDDKGQRITAKSVIKYYINDETMIQRDIPLMFEYETRPQDHWFGKWENRLHPWHDIFVNLINEQQIPRDLALQKIIEMQTKDWNTQTKSFFKKVFIELNATPEELLALQDHLFVLLHSEFSATVGFALDQIKLIYQHADFKLEEYFTWLEPLMMRADLKSQIKTIIMQLQNLLKDQSPSHNQILLLLSEVFLQSDLALQERSAKLLAKYHTLANEEVHDKLAMYQENLLGDVKVQLAAYFNANADTEQITAEATFFESALSNYHYQIPQPDYLNPEQKVELISTWEDLLFFMGQLPYSNNPLDFDIFMSSWLVYRAQRPTDYKQQLEAVLKTFHKVQTSATYKTMFQQYFAEYISEQVDQWTDNFRRQQANEHKILRCWTQLMQSFTALDLKASNLALLCLPTHAPSYIEPEVLVQRILAYQQQDIDIDLLDLSIALARMPRQNLNPAIDLSTKIENVWVKQIVLFALGQTEIPSEIPPQYSLIKNKIILDDWLGLWKTVIQTHHPFVEFSALDKSVHVNIVEPFVLPYEFSPRFEHVWDNKKGQYLKQQTGKHVRFPLNYYQNAAKTDLYQQQAYKKSDQQYFWDYATSAPNSVFFRHLTPLNLSLPDLHLASNHCYQVDHLSAQISDLFTRMMDEDYVINAYSLLIIATHLFAPLKESRLYAIESFNAAIYQHKIELEVFTSHLAQLIVHQYAPFSRLVESLASIQQASPLHANALLQIIQELIPQLEFSEKLPTQFKRFIELYYLLHSAQKAQISPTIQEKLLAWQEMSASLKPLVNKLLKGQ